VEREERERVAKQEAKLEKIKRKEIELALEK
jgi:hypothetical protein